MITWTTRDPMPTHRDPDFNNDPNNQRRDVLAKVIMPNRVINGERVELGQHVTVDDITFSNLLKKGVLAPIATTEPATTTETEPVRRGRGRPPANIADY